MAGEMEFNAALDALLARVEVGARLAAADSAHLIEAAAKRKSPVRTGTLRRSEHVEPSEDLAYRVGPTVVYARRIELGFDGADVLGRVYHQKPRPYLRPAVRESLPGILRVTRRRLVAAIRG